MSVRLDLPLASLSLLALSRAGAGSLEEAEAIMSRQWDPSPGEVTEATGRLAPRSAREAAAKQKLDELEVSEQGSER